jgi:tetratricopeptide (TPR) repeat protein
MSSSKAAWAVALGLALLPAPSPAAAQATNARTLVMPFDTGSDPRAWWLGEGVAVALADALRALGVDVIGRDERLSAFARLQVPPVPTLTHGTVIRVGQLVGAQGVVFGTIALSDDVLVVRSRNLRLDTGRLGAEVEERGKLPDLFAIVERVAGRVAPLNVTPPPGHARQPPPSPQAFEHYMKGLLAETPATQVPLLEKALALDPGFDRARLALWRVHTEDGSHENALEHALAVKAGPRAAVAQFDAALSEIALGRYDAAFDRLKAIGDPAASAAIANNVGVVQVRRGSNEATGTPAWWFAKATQADPADADLFFNLGYAYWLEQDLKASVYWLREAVRRDPADADSHFVLGSALKLTGAVTEGERELELARRLSEAYETADPKASVPRGLERLKASLDPGGPRRADVVLGQAEQRDQRELAAFHLDRGRRFFEKESDREAIAELQRALYLSPYLAEAHLLLGRTLLRGGRTGEAIDALKIAVWSEDTARGHLALAEAYQKAHQPEPARAEAERALALDPQLSAARELLEQLPPPPQR